MKRHLFRIPPDGEAKDARLRWTVAQVERLRRPRHDAAVATTLCQHLPSLNERGLIFTTDAILAVMVALTLTYVFMSTIHDSRDGNLQEAAQVRLGYDVGIALAREGVLSSGNQSLQEARLKIIKPHNQKVSLTIERIAFINETTRLISSHRVGDTLDGNLVSVDVLSFDDLGMYYLTRVRVGGR